MAADEDARYTALNVDGVQQKSDGTSILLGLS